MNWPPMLMHVKVKNKDVNFGIWIPLVLIFLVALAVVIALLPLILLAAIIMLIIGFGGYAMMPFLAIWGIFTTCFALKGLRVNVQGPAERVIVSVI